MQALFGPAREAAIALAGTTLTARSVELFLDAEDPPRLRWRAEFTR